MEELSCSQCGRPIPDDPGELALWRFGDRVLSGELDEAEAAMLLCPDCVEAERAGAYEGGVGD